MVRWNAGTIHAALTANRFGLLMHGEIAPAKSDSTVPGRMRIGLRNILIHHYFEIDHELVWQVVEGDLDSLRRVVESANLLIASRQVERAGRAAGYL